MIDAAFFSYQSPPGSGGNDGATPTTYDPSWQKFRNLTGAQVAWFSSQPQFLTYYAGAKRFQKEVGGIVLNGLPVDMDPTCLSLINGLAVRATRDQASNPNAVYQWTDAGVVTPLTVSQALGLFDAVSGFIQACRATEAQILGEIAAGTITQLSQIDAALAAVSNAITSASV